MHKIIYVLYKPIYLNIFIINRIDMKQGQGDQNQVKIDKMYPDLSDRLSVQQKQFMNQIKIDQTKWQTNPVQQGFNPVVLPVLQLKFNVIRSHQSWKDIVKQTVNWVNKNIHPLRIISISAVLCHSTGAGQFTVFYNDSKDEFMKQKISPLAQYHLSAAIVETAKSWDSHHKDVMKSAAQLGASGGIICISQLQTGATHNRATSIVWFLQKS